jgi:hypothetical protein
MVEASINTRRSSLWGFMNESGDDKEVGASLLPANSPPPSVSSTAGRTVTNATMHIRTPGARRLDVISFNIYPGWYEGANTADPRPLDRHRADAG